jgi:hypothetical protein
MHGSKNYFLKIKKYHFNIFWHEKYFEKQPQPHSQTGTRVSKYLIFFAKN